MISILGAYICDKTGRSFKSIKPSKLHRFRFSAQYACLIEGKVTFQDHFAPKCVVHGNGQN